MHKDIIQKINQFIDNKTLFYSNKGGFYIVKNEFIFEFKSIYDKFFITVAKDREKFTLEVFSQDIQPIVDRYMQQKNKIFNNLPKRVKEPVIEYLRNNIYDEQKIERGFTYVNPYTAIYLHNLIADEDIHALSVIDLRIFDLKNDKTHILSIMGIDTSQYKFFQHEIFKIYKLSNNSLIEDILLLPQLSQLFNAQQIYEKQNLESSVIEQKNKSQFKI